MPTQFTLLTPVQMAKVVAATPAAERPGLSPWLDSVAIVAEDDSSAFTYRIVTWVYDDGPFSGDPPRPVDPDDGGDYVTDYVDYQDFDEDTAIYRTSGASVQCYGERVSFACFLKCDDSYGANCIGRHPPFGADRYAVLAEGISHLRSRGFSPANFNR